MSNKYQELNTKKWVNKVKDWLIWDQWVEIKLTDSRSLEVTGTFQCNCCVVSQEAETRRTTQGSRSGASPPPKPDARFHFSEKVESIPFFFLNEGSLSIEFRSGACRNEPTACRNPGRWNKARNICTASPGVHSPHYNIFILFNHITLFHFAC